MRKVNIFFLCTLAGARALPHEHFLRPARSPLLSESTKRSYCQYADCFAFSAT